MKNIYICNTYSDSISQINLKEFKEEKKIKLSSKGRVGPHGICRYKNYLITANNFSNDITLINLASGEITSYYIGANCNDIKVYNEKAYIACGDTNDLKIFNLREKKLEESIPCGACPHSIDISEKLKLLVVCNMVNGTLNIVNLKDNLIMDTIKVGYYPTKCILGENDEHILVTNSELGRYNVGDIKIIDMDLKYIKSVSVGKGPVDLFNKNNKVYVSNFEEGSISIIDMSNLKNSKKINLGGMPKGILNIDDKLYVGDYYNSLLYKVDLIKCNIRRIYIGKEPNSMILV